MKKSIHPHPEAAAELLDSVRWYESERVGLGDEFWHQIQTAVDLISEHPGIGNHFPARTRGLVRRLRVRRFPYFLIYREHSDFIELLAVAHMSRRPGYWRSRGA